ncbi:MAG: methionine--tRNA ligase subunit beta [Candidatus Eisenbacteria bacterium]|uniref:Methionine--tRNA ligase n=1 Tax=Eiseniibacteriota bacterium TaxID=2212470 RepID=A0A956LYN5_UNCEI|nr:methionine--tRNA ligase subunit beta [Candidatus Eisenbacteria bacterium]
MGEDVPAATRFPRRLARSGGRGPGRLLRVPEVRPSQGKGDLSMTSHPDAEAPRPQDSPRESAGSGPAEPASSTPSSSSSPPESSAPASGAAPDSTPAANEDALISIDAFARADLRVAQVLHVEPHPNADRLLKLQIDLGSERRQLVAGLAAYYKPEDLIGKQIVVVANLKPAKLRGEVSQGMLLAGSDEEGVAILMPARPMAPGSKVR